ncbi:BioY family transporter [Kribbella sp. ALI-6-A]|uniref:biotin transporter BioY n=1 Tax=Kribbella sp. ALI-6-A TaxID=1933817 RepID=UPI00097C50F9|nr:biotin transporter BioY [Kribbella sp. ALI-6-A]ONI66802.1 BioY family transporter [Kribbella sp. ALI-6-A]
MAVPRLATNDLARVAVFAALIAVLGLPGAVNLFGAVPVTAQSLGVMLAGALLGPWLGALSISVLLVLVALGMPLLAGGRGGLGVFVGPSAGYLLGWILGAVVVGLLVRALGRRTWASVLVAMVLGGIVAIYAVGIPVQSAVTRLPLSATLLQSLVFLPGDLLKAALATAVTMRLARAYPRAFRTTVPAGAARQSGHPER